jgi:uncharacterized protein YgiM (DUF1202 family)
MGLPVGELRAGDEVDVIGRRGVWTEVRTPRGRVGWLHRTTLEVPAAEAVAAPSIATGPASEPELASAIGSVDDEPPNLDRMLAAIVAERRATAARLAQPEAPG